MSSTYETPCRFSDDPAAPTVMLVWEWTDQDFLPGEQVINSKHWASEGERETVVGEQWDFPPRTIPRDIPIGLLGGHQCGTTSDFANGEEWPYTGDPVKYDEDWVPLCCPRYYGLTVGAHPESEVTTGPVVPYGPDCCAAGDAQADVTYTAELVDGGLTDSQWYRYTLPAGNYSVEFTDTDTFSDRLMRVFKGATCSTATTFLGALPHGFALPFTLAAPAVVCVQMAAFPPVSDLDYSLTLTTLP